MCGTPYLQNRKTRAGSRPAPCPSRPRQIDNRLERHHRRVVDHDVDVDASATTVASMAALTCHGVGYVRRGEQGLAMFRRDVLDCSATVLLVEVDDRDPPAFVGESLTRSPADAGPAAADDTHFAGESHRRLTYVQRARQRCARTGPVELRCRLLVAAAGLARVVDFRVDALGRLRRLSCRPRRSRLPFLPRRRSAAALQPSADALRLRRVSRSWRRLRPWRAD